MVSNQKLLAYFAIKNFTSNMLKTSKIIIIKIVPNNKILEPLVAEVAGF